MTLATERKRAGRLPFQVVTLELDTCPWTYASSPCAAVLGTTGADRCYNTRASCQDPSNYERLHSRLFNVGNDVVRKSGQLTGVADSKKGTLICVYKQNVDSPQGGRWLANFDRALDFLHNSTGGVNKYRITCKNSAGSTILQVNTGIAMPASSGWHVLMCSWDLAVAGSLRFYDGDVNVRATSGDTFTNDTIQYTDTVTTAVIGAQSTGAGFAEGCMRRFYFAPGEYVDFDLEIYRRRVVSRLGTLVDMGPQGKLLTGNQPAVYMDGDSAGFVTNKGYGGTFTAPQNTACATLTPYPSGDKKSYKFCPNLTDLPLNVGAFPFLEDVRTTPARLNPDRGLGERGSVSIVLRDAPHHDRGIDPYVSQRSYDPMGQGSFFTKLLARTPYYVGRRLRIETGYLTGSPATYDSSNFETREYIIEKIDGPDASGRVVVTGKDRLKLADDDRAVVPRPAKGRLTAALTSSATSFSVGTGLGSNYASQGYLRINREIMRFTRSADTFTIVGTDFVTASTAGRGRFNTIAAAHEQDDSVQECYSYAAVDGATGEVGRDATVLVYDWLVSYAGIDPNLIAKTDWDFEEANFLPNIFSGIIAEPIGVAQAINELAEQAGFYMWVDEITGLVQLRAIRPASASEGTLTEDAHFIAGSVAINEEAERRVSQAIVYFGQRDPTEPLDMRANYRGTLVQVSDSDSAFKYGQSRIKEIFSRWIPATGLSLATSIGQKVLERFGEAPHTIRFSLDGKDAALVRLGDLFTARSRLSANFDGSKKDVVYQILEAKEAKNGTRYDYLGLEERYNPEAANTRYIYVLDGERNLNLRAAHDAQYAVPIGGETIRCVILEGATLGSTSDSQAATAAALNIGSWPANVSITVEIIGRIQGKGGTGGSGGKDGAGNPATAGNRGGIAIYTRYAITLIDTNGELWAGGGGGGGGGADLSTSPPALYGGGGGGGGAGTDGGDAGLGRTDVDKPGSDGNVGTASAGGTGGVGGSDAFGIGGTGGTGGSPGNAGSAGADGSPGGSAAGAPGAAGGAAGYYVDGWSYVTVSGGAGDRRGLTIN